MLTLKQNPKSERSGSPPLTGQRLGMAAMLRARERVQPLTPAALPGLVLWLDAARGGLATWCPAPTNGNVMVNYGAYSGYTAVGIEHKIRIYPFRTENGQTVFSPFWLEVTFTDDNSIYIYDLTWSWDAAPGAEGYRVCKYNSYDGWQFDHYQDVYGTYFTDSDPRQWSSDPVLDPLPGVSNAGPDDIVVRWEDWWNSTEAIPDDVSNEDVVIELNTDYSTRGLTANEIVAIVQAWQSLPAASARNAAQAGGALSRDSMLDIFRRGEVLPEGRTNEEEVRLIAIGKPEPAGMQQTLPDGGQLG